MLPRSNEGTLLLITSYCDWTVNNHDDHSLVKFPMQSEQSHRAPPHSGYHLSRHIYRCTCVRPTDPLVFALRAETRAKSGSSQGLALTCKWVQDEVHLLCAWSPCQCLTTLSPLYREAVGNRHSSYRPWTHVKNLLPEIAVHRYTVVKEGKAGSRLIRRQTAFESYSSLKGNHCPEENSEMSL